MRIHPLSFWLYNWRNAGRAMPLLLILILTVFSTVLISGLIQSIPQSILSSHGYLKKISAVVPTQDTSLSAGIVQNIRTFPAVASVIHFKSMVTNVRLIAGTTSFGILAVDDADMTDLLALYDVKINEGRLPRPGSNEMALSEPIAKAKGLSVGSQMGRSIDEAEWVPGVFSVVGILEGDTRLGLVSLEYLSTEDLFLGYPEGILVIPRAQQEAAMNTFLTDLPESEAVSVATYDAVLENVGKEMRNIYTLLAIVNGLTIAIVSLAVGVLNYIYFLHRVPEFAILKALGFSRASLIRRLALEIGSLMSLAWLIGVLLGVAVLAWLSQAVFLSRGLLLLASDPRPILFSLPIPILVSVLGIMALLRPLISLDPVTIIDRRL
jgi:putative ABC transport system permease protein